MSSNVSNKDMENVIEIPISQIIPPKLHDRKSYDLSEIESLARNIENTKRVLQPIIVRKVSDGYERIAGFRRVEAVKLLGWDSIPAVVLFDISDQEAMLIMLSENMQREDLNQYDQTVGILQYISLSLDMTVDEVKKLLYRFRNMDNGLLKEMDTETKKKRDDMGRITKRLGNISVATLINRLKMFSLSDTALNALKSGKVGYSAAQEINKIKDTSKAEELVDEVFAGNLSLRDLKKIIKEEKNKTKPQRKKSSNLFYTMTDEGGWISMTLENITPGQVKKLENFLKKL